MSQWMTQELGVIRTLLIATTGVGAILSVFMTYIVTKALMKTLGALVLAGAVVWGVANVDWFKTKVGEETGNTTQTQQQGLAPVHATSQSTAASATGVGHRVVVRYDGTGSTSFTLVSA